MSKASEMREMSDEQLTLSMKEASNNLFHLRIKAQTERLDTPTELQKNRRLIARAKTILRERELKAAAK
jgi:large subunit ribosomal protein L29